MILRRSTIGGIGILVLAASAFGRWGDAPLSAGSPQAGVELLFVDAPQRALRQMTGDPTVVRSRRVTIDFAALADPGIADVRMAARAALLLNVFDDTSLTAVRDRIDQAENGFTWVGHIPGIDLSTVTLASVDGIVSGSIVMPEAVYGIRYLGGGVHEVAQIDQSKFPSELDPIAVTPTDTHAGMTAAQDAGGPIVMGDDGSTIDVLVLYTPAAAAAANGAMASRVNLGVSEANTSYINSGITQRLRLVKSQQVAYSENSDLAQDLYAVSNSRGPTALGDSAVSLRNTYGADLVMLITSPAGANACGVAFLMTSVSTLFAPNGFSVVEQSCISPNYTFAHELGHNMGARHDWYMDSARTPDTWAHGYVDTQNRFRTVMSYNNACSIGLGFNCTRLLYWSNPGVNSPGAYGSAPMGIPGGTKSDCPKGDASNISCDADDHRTLNSTAFTVANFRQSARQTPVVAWADPASVVAGTVLGATQLNATATVNGTPVAGTFVYSPPAGTVLAVGTQTLSTTFTPTDTITYTTATASVTIVVTGACTCVGSGSGFAGPGSGGPAIGSVNASQTQLTYSGATYPIVSGRVTFPDCTIYIALGNGMLIPGGTVAGCTSTGGGGSGGSGGSGGGGFVGPGNGGPATGTVNASQTQLTYSGATYPIVNGKVTFPDCTTYIALGNGMLIPAGIASGCTPGTGGGGASTPTITWANPASAVAGTALSPTQLNATASVPGSFVYTPPAGTVLNTVGTQILSVTFTPTDTTSYTTATKTVTIVVTASGGGGGGVFVGPGTGGPATGTVNAGETQLTYNGAAYPMVNGRVTFPDCTVYIALRNGMLIPAGTASGCIPAGGGGSGGSGGGGGGGFVGPGTGGPATGTVNAGETQLTYNGTAYPMVNGRVTFPDCTVYIALRNGMLIPAGMAPGCTPSDRHVLTTVPAMQMAEATIGNLLAVSTARLPLSLPPNTPIRPGSTRSCFERNTAALPPSRMSSSTCVGEGDGNASAHPAIRS